MWVKHEAASGAVFHYMRNHQGSVIGYVDATSGSQQAIYTYDAYGNSPGAEASGQPYRYTGRRYDAETGLYYYRARYYSPKLGRFLQTDPIGYEDNMNMYGYVGNDPVNATDPAGLCSVSEGQLTECEVTRDDDLTDDQNAAADKFIETLVVVGEAIYASGDQELIDAFESIDVVSFSSDDQSESGAAANASRSNEPDAVEKGRGRDVLTFFGQALETGGNGDTATLITGHEVEHFTQRNRDLSRLNQGNAFMQRQTEVSTDKRAIGFLQKSGLLPTPYTSQSTYTRGRSFP